MPESRVRVLLIDDDADSFSLVRTLLALSKDRRYDLDWVDTLEDARTALEARAADVYLVDYRFGGRPVGLDFIRDARARGFREPMILLTAQGDREVDERAMHVGASDYLDKLQLETRLLERTIRHAIERTRTLEALRQSQQFLQSTVDALGASIAILDADGVIVAVNEAWRGISIGSSFTGASCGVGDNFIEVCERVPAGERVVFGPLAAGIRDVIDGRRESFITEYTSTDAAGTASFHLARVTRFAGGGQGRAVVACEDVSELKRAEEALRLSEEQLRQSQKLEAVGRLAGGVAHDFNNLLTAIAGHTEFLLRRVEPPDPLYWHVEGIKKAASRAAALTRQLLAFSRKQVLQPRVLDLNEIVVDLEKMLRRIIGENVRFDTSLDEKLGRIEADPGQIEQVIVNLVVNARDAMPDGGRLVIETRNVAVSEASGEKRGIAPGPYVELAVRDSGTGMDEETVAHIFEPFFTTKPQGKGTGLGLSTVDGIVAQSDGAIDVRSALGEGSTFLVYLPIVEGDVTTDATPSDSSEPSRGSETVLLVEDDNMVRDVARRILQMAGYFVLEVNQPFEALAVCQQYEGPIHLMLTDVVMPGMSGRELAERVADVRKDMRIVFMSGYLDDEIDTIGVARESDRFIAKPFLPNELIDKIRKVLDS